MATAPRSTRIEAPARLHLGFLDPSASRGRRFGSIGLALDNIATVVSAAPYAEFVMAGAASERAREHAANVISHYGLNDGLRVEIEQSIPAHAGLGSGTQLALAVGTALLEANARSADITELARLLGRGKRSGIGLGLFEHGGLIVDGGHGPLTSSPPIICRLPFPAQWRIVLIFDRASEGLSGRAESAAFGALEPMPRAQAARLCHATLMTLLPAVAEQDFAGFSSAIAEVQTIVGDYFAAMQAAGAYTSGRVRAAVDHVQAVCGLAGVGQSSWGPTAFVFTPSQAAAEDVVAELRRACVDMPGLDYMITAARNHGARIERDAPSAAPRIALA
jgi:beta-ribofuranosylaminobenzene 5'-phosphate synthase